MNIVMLTGAGVSAESGLKTFRDNNGLWEGHRIEDVATPEAFEKNPALVHQFYNQRRQQLLSDQINSNTAHEAIARLEKEVENFTLVTQNVDNLHERAGHEKVFHMHGCLDQVRCTKCYTVESCDTDISESSICSSCDESSSLRPDIVWFGEMPYYMNLIQNKLKECDLFVAVGTSGQVYPAAGFVEIASSVSANTVEINLERTETSDLFETSIQGLASIEVPKFVDELLSQLK